MRKTGINAHSGFEQTLNGGRTATFQALIFGDARTTESRTFNSPIADSAARTMLQSYDWKGALESCREVLKHDPDHLGALEVTAQALWFAGNYEEVVRTTNRLLQLNPLEPGYRYTRGMALMSMGQLVRAADDFRQAINQSNNPRFIVQVQASLTAIEEFQSGGPDRIARMNAARIAKRSTEFGPLTDNRVH